MKKNILKWMVTAFVIAVTSQSFSTVAQAQQVFTLNGGYQSFPAQEAGTPNLPKGNVLVRRAPAAAGNINRIRQTLNAATIPDVVIRSRLTEGPLAGYIAQMPAVISTANRLNQRPDTANVAGAIIINNTAALNANRNRIRNNNRETYIFRGTVNVNEPIVVGSNKTFWIDGRVTYTGPERPLANTDKFSPIPIIRDGIFRMVGKRNINIRGTKRGLVDCRSRLPFAYALDSREIEVTGNEVINGFNSIFMHQTKEVTIEDNFLYNNVRRAIHLIAVNGYSVKNNLTYINHLDGIDVDAFSQNGNVELNVVVGVNFRFMLWTEIDAHDNTLNNNVAIHLPGRKGRGVGGMQENGTENSRRGVGSFRGSRNNDWLNNNVFYAEKFRDGIVMRRDRFIQHNTVNFRNNYVWTVEGNGQRHNPKPQAGNVNDVRFLTLQQPAAGTKPNPTNLYPNGGPEVVINNAPGNLTGDQIRVTPGLFGGGNGNPGNGNRFQIPGTIQAEKFTSKNGSVRIEDTPNSNGENLGYIVNRDSVTYRVNVGQSGVYTVNTFVSSDGRGGTLEFSSNGTVLGSVRVNPNNNWHNYFRVSTNINLNANTRELTLNFKGGNGFLYNIDRLRIERSFNVPGTIQAENFVRKNGSVRTQDTPNSNNKNLAYIRNRDSASYDIKVQKTGIYTVSAFVSSEGNGGTLEFVVNDAILGTIQVFPNNNWHNYVRVSTDISLNKNDKELKVNFRGRNGYLFNIDRLQIR